MPCATYCALIGLACEIEAFFRVSPGRPLSVLEIKNRLGYENIEARARSYLLSCNRPRRLVWIGIAGHRVDVKDRRREARRCAHHALHARAPGTHGRAAATGLLPAQVPLAVSSRMGDLCLRCALPKHILREFEFEYAPSL